MLNHKQVISLKPKSTTYKKGLGNGLFVVVDKVYKGKNGTKLGGRKYFKGRIKGQEVNVGVFGNNAGELTLKNARDKFSAIKDYCHKNEISYSDFKREKEERQRQTWNLSDAIIHFLKECEESIKPTTHREYTRKLNQVLSLVDGNTPLKEFEWDRGGKEKLEDIITQIENGGKGNNYDLGRRVRNLLNQVFNKAIYKQYKNLFK